MKTANLLLTSATSLIVVSAAGAAFSGEITTPEPEAVAVVAPQSSPFGYIGVNLSYSSGTDEGNPTEYTSFSQGLEGAFALPLANGAAVVVDALVHFDNFDDPDPHWGVDSLAQYQASVHYLHPLGDNLTVGGFAGYGFAPFDSTDEEYQVGFLGATLVFDASDALALFGQAGYGTSFDPDAMNSAGFYNGYVVRAGAIYSGLSFATLRAEAEYAATEQYEDAFEPGEMWTVAILGESAVGASGSLVATYGVRYAYFDAVGDSNNIRETSLNLGVKYMFGGGTTDKFYDIGYVGSPYLPLRGSFWTPHMD